MTRVQFFAVRDLAPLAGLAVYRRGEYSFDFIADSPVDVSDRVGADGVATILIDDLQVSLSAESGRLLFAWGYEYFGRWAAGHLGWPDWSEAAVFARDIEPWESGTGRRVGAAPEWAGSHDADSGWVRFFNQRVMPAEEDRYLIATDTVVGLVG
jgi:hypothetical protein